MVAYTTSDVYCISPEGLNFEIYVLNIREITITNENIYFENYYNEQHKFTNDSYSI